MYRRSRLDMVVFVTFWHCLSIFSDSPFQWCFSISSGGTSVCFLTFPITFPTEATPFSGLFKLRCSSSGDKQQLTQHLLEEDYGGLHSVVAVTSFAFRFQTRVSSLSGFSKQVDCGTFLFLFNLFYLFIFCIVHV